MPRSDNSSLGVRLSALWKEVLSVPPPANVAELWKEHQRIRGELESLGLANTTNNSRWKRSTDRLARLPKFIEWCTAKGVEHADLGISSPSSEDNENDELCLLTTKPLAEREIAASVPHQMLLCVDQCEQIESLRKIVENDEMLRSMDNVCLAMIVAHEVLRGAESDWAPYLDMLPASFQTPIFYTEKQLLSLKPSPVFEEALGMYRAIARQFVYFFLRILGDTGEKAKKHLLTANNNSQKEVHPFAGSPFNSHSFTFDFYCWCVSLVSTRINIVPSRTKCDPDGTPKLIPALIPFIDLANHAHSAAKPASVFYEPASDQIKLQLNSSLEAGQELCIFYGKRTNGKFLLHNGFVPASNPDDFFELKIGLPLSAPNSLAKMEHLQRKKIGMLPQQQQQSRVYSFLLNVDMDAEELKKSALWTFALAFVASSADILEDEEKLNSPENAQKAAKFLADRFRLLLRGYGGNGMEEKEEEENSAKETAKTSSSNNAIDLAIAQLKRKERVLLASYLNCVEQIHQQIAV